MCDLKLKGLLQLSVKNLVWLVICVFMYVLLLIELVRHLAVFADSMAALVSILSRHKLPKFARPRLPNTKYILLWKSNMDHINYLKCNAMDATSNCFWTEEHSFFGDDYSKFDAILFDHTHFTRKWVPIRRSPSQLYIFTSTKPSSLSPACGLQNEGFFNWTFTYRLDSDIVWKFFVVKDLSGSIMAPNSSVQWNETKYPISHEIKTILQRKNKTVAWIVNDCKTMKSEILMELQEQLLYYSLQIDIYGDCSKKACTHGDCETMLRKYYHFYIAFESSPDDDYVTREILHGYNNFVVPIVYGAADYNKFLPPGSYINAREVSPQALADLIHQSKIQPAVHESFFHWTHLYTIDTNYITSAACDLCGAINTDEAKDAPPKKNFRFWWNTPHGMKSCLPNELRNKFAVKNRSGILK